MVENLAITADRYQFVIALWQEFKVIDRIAMTVPFILALAGLREGLIDSRIIHVTMIPFRIEIRSITQQIADFLIACSELCEC